MGAVTVGTVIVITGTEEDDWVDVEILVLETVEVEVEILVLMVIFGTPATGVAVVTSPVTTETITDLDVLPPAPVQVIA